MIKSEFFFSWFFRKSIKKKKKRGCESYSCAQWVCAVAGHISVAYLFFSFLFFIFLIFSELANKKNSFKNSTIEDDLKELRNIYKYTHFYNYVYSRIILSYIISRLISSFPLSWNGKLKNSYKCNTHTKHFTHNSQQWGAN